MLIPFNQLESGTVSRQGTVLHARVVTGTGGGPDKTVLNSPRFLKPYGYPSLCAYLHPPNDPGILSLLHRTALAECRLVPIPDKGPLDFSVVRKLLQLCRRENVSIWHGHDYKTNALGLLLRRFHRMQLVTTVHGWVHHTRRTPLYYWIDRQCLRRYDHVICVSDDLYTECLARGVRPERCTLVQNAVDTVEFVRRESSSVAKRRLGFCSDRLLIGAVGRLAEEKGFHILIDVVDRLCRSGVDVELAIIGEGEERGRLEAQIRSTSCPDRFHLLGYRSETIDLYQAMDVFALSSLREGLPNVLLEAMALEVPVVATRIAGIPRLVRNEQNGLLVSAGSEEELHAGLGRLLRDASLRSTLAANARTTVETEYSFAVRMEKVRRIYDQVLGTSPGAIASGLTGAGTSSFGEPVLQNSVPEQ